MTAAPETALDARAVRLQAFTSGDFRATLGAFPTGVTVITTCGAGDAYGMTASAFCSVSLDPPLVLICISRTARASQAIDTNGVFAINILAADQEPVSRYFASKDRPQGRDMFGGVPHREEVTGSPILEGVAGYVDCRLDARHAAGDHLVFIGEVLALGADAEATPLVFHAGGYRFLTDA